MRLLITAGPTIEPIDPVRYISNRSSGKMGYGLATAGIAKGYEVLLISGPTNLEIPKDCEFISIQTAHELYEQVQRHINQFDLAIFTSAVADYRVTEVSQQKIKKNHDEWVLNLMKNPDVLGSARQPFGFAGTLVGFAAETNQIIENAREKLENKKCDFIIANDVSRPDIGFEVADNEVIIISKDEEQTLPKQSKLEIAESLLTHFVQYHQSPLKK